METKELIIKFSYILLKHGATLVNNNVFTIPAYWSSECVYTIKLMEDDLGRVIITGDPTFLDITLYNEQELLRLLEQLNIYSLKNIL